MTFYTYISNITVCYFFILIQFHFAYYKISKKSISFYLSVKLTIHTFRDEAPDVRAQRMLTVLKTLKYNPSSSTDVSNFRQGIVLGEKPVIHPILLYLLTHLKSLKTRAYLARFLVTLSVSIFLLFDILLYSVEITSLLLEEFLMNSVFKILCFCKFYVIKH